LNDFANTPPPPALRRDRQPAWNPPQAGLKVGTITHGVVDNCKPGSVIAVSPLAPTVLHAGDKVDLGLCG
jgi:hypothetical protein